MLRPGSAIDLSEDVKIDGVPVSALNGRYLLVTVSLIRPSALRAAVAKLTGDEALVERADLLPPGVSEQQYLEIQRKVFESSRMAAAAAAALARGMQVSMTGSGALVTDLVEASPAARALRVGDVIVAVNGRSIKLVGDMTELTTTAPAGTRFTLTVRRGESTLRTTVRSVRLDGFTATGTGIGVLTSTDRLKVELPFEIEFAPRDIGGPSVGLAYALAIADLLDPADLARGRTIAATGAISPRGEVDGVGGIRQKAQVAREAGADLLVVPSGDAAAPGASGRTEGVGDLIQALEVLRAS